MLANPRCYPPPPARPRVVAGMRRSTALMVSALLLLALSLAVAFTTAVPHDERSEEVETRRMFRDWMARYEKTYSSIDEEEHRYAVFKENLRGLGKRNAAAAEAEDGVHLGLNVFGDLTHEELRILHTGCMPGDVDYKYSLLYWINILRWGSPSGHLC